MHANCIILSNLRLITCFFISGFCHDPEKGTKTQKKGERTLKGRVFQVGNIFLFI